MNSIYSKYFQKSKSFLYPLLGIKKSLGKSPVGTYISIEGIIDADDMKLICSFKKDFTLSFIDFEQQMLITNPLYEKVIEIDDYKLYIFDLSIYKHDWFNFLLGKYSKLSTVVKKAIKAYYGESSAEYQYMESYLYPEKYFKDYAKILDVDIEDLKQIGELCDPWDSEKETLKISIENLISLKKDD
jgi:hypothetical protein